MDKSQQQPQFPRISPNVMFLHTNQLEYELEIAWKKQKQHSKKLFE